MRVLARLCPNPRYHLGALTMNTNPVPWLQAYIIGVLIFLVSVTAITKHPEWFN